MKYPYEETDLRSNLSKYANERIEFVGYVNGKILIRFKEGFGTSLITGTVNSQIFVKTITYMKEVCLKSHLMEGERILKSRQSNKDLAYYKAHYAMAMEEAQSYLERAKYEWDIAELLQKKAASLQKKALALKLMILKETKDWSEEATVNLLDEIEKNTYGNPLTFNRHSPEIEGTDFFFKMVLPDVSQSVDTIYWDEVYSWGIISDYKEINFDHFPELLKYIETL